MSQTSKKAPQFLNIFQMRFPVMAIVSIAHRLSGIALAVLLPWIIWVWSKVITLKDYHVLQTHLHSFSGRLFGIIVGLALFFHLLSGSRHLLMDLGFFELKASGRMTAWLVWATFGLGVVIMGAWLWVW